MTKHSGSLFIAMTLVICFYSSALALTDEEVFSQFQFNFITPGARATALGGAFIGLADDATAVESNPAGLTKLGKPEVSVEFKYIGYTTNQIYANDDYINPDAQIKRKNFDDSVGSVPFVSVVYPYNGEKRKFVFSVYRQELVNYKSSFRTGRQAISVPGSYDPIDSPWGIGFYPVDASVDLTVTNYGIGVAVEFFEGHLSLAASPRWSTMSMRSHSARFDWNEYGVTDFRDDQVKNETIIDDADSGFSVNAGLKWDPDPRVSFGAVYRSGITFTVKETPSPRDPGDFLNELRPGNDYNPDLAEFTLTVPDSFGTGVAFRALDTDRHSLQFTLDVVHIRYTDLLKDFDILMSSAKKDEFTVDNVTEMHVGVEYELKFIERTFLQSLFLRAGIYNEPDHTIRYTGSDTGYREMYPGGEEQTHYTGGVGIVVNDHIQIDTAANIAKNNAHLSISGVYRF